MRLPIASALLLCSAAASGAMPGDLTVQGGTAQPGRHKGREGVRLVPEPGQESGDTDMLAIVGGDDFQDGTIEVDLAGAPRAGSHPGMRGFIGLAFRVQPQGAAFECFYLRTLNARSEDQEQRNHSAQYVSEPNWGWRRLRAESPSKYEAYVDLEPDVWTHLKIVVAGNRATLFVNGASQPTLIVRDLRLGPTKGKVALWTHVSTDAWFANLSLKR